MMPKSYKSHKFILFIIDELTNYLITVPIHKLRSEEIGDAFIDNVILKCCIPDYKIMYQVIALMSVNELFTHKI